MKTKSTTTTTLLLLLLLALAPAALHAQEGNVRRTGELTTNTGFQDFEGAFNQTIQLKFGAKPVTLALPAGSAAAITLPEVASFIGIYGDELDMSSYIGLMDDEIALSSQAKIRKLDEKRFAVRGIEAGEVSVLLKDKKGREAILIINVTEPEPEEEQEIKKE